MKNYGLKLSRIKQIYRSFNKNYSVIHEMIQLKTTDLDELLDPKVKNLKDKLLYSDYIESKRLKLGYKKNAEIKIKLRHKFQHEKEEIERNNKPLSIALKYIDDEDNLFTEFENCSNLDKKNEFEQKDERPIHMPYSTIDKYEKLSSTKNFEHLNDEAIPEINEKYRVLYEKYLDISKYTTIHPNKSEDNKSVESKIQMRLEDDFSKVSKNWMTDYEIYDDILEENLKDVKYGTPDVNTEVSSVPCGGCGALLHCKDVALPGYLPSELFLNKKNSDLQSITCQRCHFMKYYDTCLDVKVSADDYPKLLEQINSNPKALILLLIDLTDFPCSIWPQLPSLVGLKRHVVVVGNKIDLLPPDSPHFIENVKDCLTEALLQTGLNKINIKHLSLISAKSGYGVEELINKLHKIWNYRSNYISIIFIDTIFAQINNITKNAPFYKANIIIKYNKLKFLLLYLKVMYI
jgi:hypothetical protein